GKRLRRCDAARRAGNRDDGAEKGRFGEHGRYSRLHPGKTRQRPSRRMMGSLTLRDRGFATSSTKGERTASRLLVHHAVAQRTDAGNLDLEHVTGLHRQWWIAAMADPFRRPGGDHVARQERREVRAERDDLRHRIDPEIGG